MDRSLGAPGGLGGGGGGGGVTTRAGGEGREGKVKTASKAAGRGAGVFQS